MAGGRCRPVCLAPGRRDRGRRARPAPDRRPVRCRVPPLGCARSSRVGGDRAARSSPARHRGRGQPVDRLRRPRGGGDGDLRGGGRGHRRRRGGRRPAERLRGRRRDSPGRGCVPTGPSARTPTRRPDRVRESEVPLRAGGDLHRTPGRGVAHRDPAADGEPGRRGNRRTTRRRLAPSRWGASCGRGLAVHGDAGVGAGRERRASGPGGRSGLRGSRSRGSARRDQRGDAAAGTDDAGNRATARPVRPGGARPSEHRPGRGAPAFPPAIGRLAGRGTAAARTRPPRRRAAAAGHSVPGPAHGARTCRCPR